MGVLTLISSPRPSRIRGEKTLSVSSSEDSFEMSSSRDRKGLLPEVSSRWKRSQSDNPATRREDIDKDSLSAFGRIRSLFASPPKSSDDSSGFLSSRSARLEPINASQLNSAGLGSMYDSLRDPMPLKRLRRDHTAVMMIDPTDSPLFELVPAKLYFATYGSPERARAHIDHRPDLFFITSDLHRCHVPDGIPIDLGAVFRFWEFMKTECSDHRSRGRRFVYYTDDRCWRNTATFLLACYMLLEHNMSTEVIVESLSKAFPVSDIDADIALSDCLRALRKAVETSLLSVEQFDVHEYERLGHPNGGAFSRFGDALIVFPRPTEMNKMGRLGGSGFSSVYYSNILERMGTTAVVRINDSISYSKRPFLERKIRHYDLTFENLPTKTTVRDFLDICDGQEGLIGVHEQDGASASCTLVCLWMMRTLDFSAREAVAWVRLVRPGAISKEQEQFLNAAQVGGWSRNWLQSLAIRSDNDADPEEEDGEEEELSHWGRTPREMLVEDQ